MQVEEGAAAANEENQELKVQDLRFYLMPSNTFVIISKDWVRFTAFTMCAYLNHVFWVLWGVDAYCSYERHMLCGDY